MDPLISLLRSLFKKQNESTTRLAGQVCVCAGCACASDTDRVCVRVCKSVFLQAGGTSALYTLMGIPQAIGAAGDIET